MERNICIARALEIECLYLPHDTDIAQKIKVSFILDLFNFTKDAFKDKL